MLAQGQHSLLSVVMFAVEDSCKWCCQDTSVVNATCAPYFNNNLPEGMPCLQGYCDAAVCAFVI